MFQQNVSWFKHQLHQEFYRPRLFDGDNVFYLRQYQLSTRIHQLHLCKGIRPLYNECPGYDTRQSDGKAPVMLELWEKRSTPSLPMLSDPLLPGVVATDKVLSMGQVEQTVCIQMTDDKF